MVRSLPGISQNDCPEGLRSELTPPASDLVCYEAFLNGPGPVIPDGEPEEAAAPEAPADETDKETTQETVPATAAPIFHPNGSVIR